MSNVYGETHLGKKQKLPKKRGNVSSNGEISTAKGGVHTALPSFHGSAHLFAVQARPPPWVPVPAVVHGSTGARVHHTEANVWRMNVRVCIVCG